MVSFRILSIAFAFVFATSPAAALQLSPFTAEFTEAEAISGVAYNVFNDTDAPIAVEVTIRYRDMDRSGEDILTEAEDDFIAFPTQMILFPQEMQVVRVQWIGEKQVDEEIPFRVIAEQIPINFASEDSKDSVKIEFLTAIASAAYLLPASPSVELIAAEVSPEARKDGGLEMLLTIENRGNHHIHLTDAKITLQSLVDGKIVQLGAEALGNDLRQSNILGGHAREYRVPWPTGLEPGPASVTSIEFTER